MSDLGSWKSKLNKTERFMKPYFETERGKLYLGDCLDVMKTLPDNSIDTLITDPPYGLSFMCKKWDYDVPGVEIWKECLRVLKPGATALIFAGSRTQHRMAVNVEDAGFILKDCIMFLYGSGFPKSTNISKQLDKMAGKEREVIGQTTRSYSDNPESGSNKTYDKIIGGDNLRMISRKTDSNIMAITAPATPEAQTWDGWGTALKPAYEPILVCQVPNDGTYAQNALKHGVAGLNIDGGRIVVDSEDAKAALKKHESFKNSKAGGKDGWERPWMEGKKGQENWNKKQNKAMSQMVNKGRFPANVILDESAAKLLDEQSGILKSGARDGITRGYDFYSTTNRKHNSKCKASQGGASRFFYTAKSSKAERGKDNTHPTVKPLSLMKYLCNLTKTPTGGVVLDPFAGSGTTGVACHNTQRPWVLIEREKEYCEIAAKRIEEAASQMSF